MQSRDTDLQNSLRDLLLDLLITGYAFYKVEPSPSNTTVKIRVLSPLNTFIDRNYESPYVKDSYRAVIRSWMSKTQILNKYGRMLSKEDIKTLDEKWESVYDNALYYIRLHNGDGVPATDGLDAGTEVTPGYPDSLTGASRELMPVYEVEWLETDSDFVMQRYKVIKIGEEIYIPIGLDKDVVRSQSNPSYCGLSVNGVYFLNRGLKPYSMMLTCANLQDKYDLLIFYRDNLIANSGTVGDWIDYTLIPAELGVNLPERIMKWLSYKKQGLGILDSSQEGRMASGQAPLNTIFNGFDNTVKLQAVQAIQVVIDSIEDTVSSITGVFKQRLNGIETYDAVSNVKMGQRNSYIVTKQYYHQMDLIVNEMLVDCLNCAKKVFKNGLTGSLTLGDKKLKIFTALPENFTLTDYDIRISTSSDVVKDLEQVRQVVPEFIKAGTVAPDILLEAMTSKSLPDLKSKLKKSMALQKAENDQVTKLTQQIQELQQQLKDSQSQLKKATSKIEQLNNDNIQLKEKELDMKYKLGWYNAQTERNYRESYIEEQKNRTQIELEQLHDNNPYNDAIRQMGT